MEPTSMQEVEVQDLVYNTKYQFRIRPALVTAANGETVEEGKEGPASVYYKTACIGNVHTSMQLRRKCGLQSPLLAVRSFCFTVLCVRGCSSGSAHNPQHRGRK